MWLQEHLGKGGGRYLGRGGKGGGWEDLVGAARGGGRRYEEGGTDLHCEHLLLAVVAQPPRELIPAGIAQHQSVLGRKPPCDLQNAGSKERLPVVLDRRHCAAVQPQLAFHRHA